MEMSQVILHKKHSLQEESYKNKANKQKSLKTVISTQYTSVVFFSGLQNYRTSKEMMLIEEWLGVIHSFIYCLVCESISHQKRFQAFQTKTLY